MTVYRSCSSFFIVDHEKVSVFPTGFMSVFKVRNRATFKVSAKVIVQRFCLDTRPVSFGLAIKAS